MEQQFLELEARLLSRLKGRILLVQPQEDREALVRSLLKESLTQSEFAHLAPHLALENQLMQFVRDFLSYDIIEDLLCDSEVEDIIINDLKPIHIHHAQHGFIPTQKQFFSHRHLSNFITKLIVFSGRTGYHKVANLELANLGGRANIIDTPLGPQLTITKAKVDPLSVIDLIKRGAMTYELAGQLWMYIQGLSIRPANIIIAGGPGTGKTTLLNSLLSFIPSKDRLVVIEDTLELNTFLDDSCSRLETDSELSLSDLVKNSLRMRPERIIIGEVRGEEARDMITAVNIGKYCMCTIHALTAKEALMRLNNEPMNVPLMLINLIDVFIILKRYHVDGKLFRVIDEVTETSGMEGNHILRHEIFKYNYDQKRVLATSPSTVFRDRLAQESGMTPRDIINETWIRAAVLKAMADRDIHTMKEVTLFCRLYNESPKDAMAKIGLDRERMLKDLK